MRSVPIVTPFDDVPFDDARDTSVDASTARGSASDAARILILADIHANREALDAVLAFASEGDILLCVGDVVG
jgi:hypothetical protein